MQALDWIPLDFSAGAKSWDGAVVKEPAGLGAQMCIAGQPPLPHHHILSTPRSSSARALNAVGHLPARRLLRFLTSCRAQPALCQTWPSRQEPSTQPAPSGPSPNPEPVLSPKSSASHELLIVHT